MKCRLAFAVAALALAFVPAAVAKDFVSLVLVGPDGRSTELRPPEAVIDQLFDGEAVEPSGGYARVYPLSRTGHVGIPGRFYPETGVVCLSWDQSAPPRSCRRPRTPLLNGLGASHLSLFVNAGVTLKRLASPRVRRSVVSQLRVAFELAFDRFRLARRAPEPASCIPFVGTWRGLSLRKRPQTFCLARDGVHTHGFVYPLGREPWQLALWNPG